MHALMFSWHHCRWGKFVVVIGSSAARWQPSVIALTWPNSAVPLPSPRGFVRWGFVCGLNDAQRVLAGCVRTAWRILLTLLQSGKANAHLNYLEQLVAVDASTAVNVVEFEVPAELLLHASLQHQAQSGDILHEINEAVLQENTETWISFTASTAPQSAIRWWVS